LGKQNDIGIMYPIFTDDFWYERMEVGPAAGADDEISGFAAGAAVRAQPSPAPDLARVYLAPVDVKNRIRWVDPEVSLSPSERRGEPTDVAVQSVQFVGVRDSSGYPSIAAHHKRIGQRLWS